MATITAAGAAVSTVTDTFLSARGRRAGRESAPHKVTGSRERLLLPLLPPLPSRCQAAAKPLPCRCYCRMDQPRSRSDAASLGAAAGCTMSCTKPAC
ncbi:hypothetical protein GCM10010431_33190 [Streptomyces kunmingensis]